MKLTPVVIALFAAATVSCSSYANPNGDEATDDPTYVGPGTGGSNSDDDDDALPPGYSTPSASAAGSDSTAAK